MTDPAIILALQALPTLAQGQADDLKIDTGAARGYHEAGDLRLWVSRMTVEDGAAVDNEVAVERMDTLGRWVDISEAAVLERISEGLSEAGI